VTTIKDVAERAGVSIATVSRALHGLPRVSEATRQRVLAVAAELHYVASPSAASLAGGQNMAIGVVAPSVNGWFVATIVDSAERLLRPAGYDVLLYSLGVEPEQRRRAFAGNVLRKRVDAVLVVGIRPEPHEVAALSAVGGPVTVVGAEVPGWASVRVDDRAVGRCAVRHLLDLGHRRIAYIGCEPAGPREPTASAGRRAGWRDQLTAVGITPDPALEVDGGFTVRGGMAAMDRLLAAPRPPTAIFSSSDEMAMGAVHVARQAGLRIPDDLSVVGVDDHDMAELFDLTTVAQPVYSQGALAAEMILRRLAEPFRAPPALVVPTELVVRGTTAPPAGSATD
jgi:LacI family transcriptional regulator, repressor for deo operon, udp, cdd, tsx, nupC, and nupG